MSDQQQPNPNPNQPMYGYAPNGAPNGYQQPQQPQQYPPGWAPQQPMMPQPYGYAPQFAPRHKLPGAALAAAIIWIIYGSLQLIGALGTLAGGRPGPQLVIGLGIGVALLMGGITTATGKAKSLLPTAIVSIVLGALVLIAMLFIGSLFRGLGGAGGIIMLIGLLFGGLLVTGGVLGCIANGKYKEYHYTKFGGF